MRRRRAAQSRLHERELDRKLAVPRVRKPKTSALLEAVQIEVGVSTTRRLVFTKTGLCG
jgi:hypothetical protein